MDRHRLPPAGAGAPRDRPGRADLLESPHGSGRGHLDPGRSGRAPRGRHARPPAAHLPGGAAGPPRGAVPRRQELHDRRRGPHLLWPALLVGRAPDGARALGPRSSSASPRRAPASCGSHSSARARASPGACASCSSTSRSAAAPVSPAAAAPPVAALERAGAHRVLGDHAVAARLAQASRGALATPSAQSPRARRHDGAARSPAGSRAGPGPRHRIRARAPVGRLDRGDPRRAPAGASRARTSATTGS